MSALTPSDSLPAVSDADLDAAAASLGQPLPESYRRFLLAHNGGRLEGWAFGYDPDLAPPGYDPAEDGIELSELFGIGDAASAHPANLLIQAKALHQSLATEGKQLPADWIWIGRTAHEDEIFLSTSGKHAGSVYLLYARDEYFEEDFAELFDKQGKLAEPDDLMLSKDFGRFWAGAAPL